MGKVLRKGGRDKVFLMSKVDGRNRDEAEDNRMNSCAAYGSIISTSLAMNRSALRN